jgi:hypothetical protein
MSEENYRIAIPFREVLTQEEFDRLMLKKKLSLYMYPKPDTLLQELR